MKYIFISMALLASPAQAMNFGGISDNPGSFTSAIQEKPLSNRYNCQYPREPSEHLRVVSNNLSRDVLTAFVSGGACAIVAYLLIWLIWGYGTDDQQRKNKE